MNSTSPAGFLSTPYKRALAAAISANVPVLIWGQPGVGKSASVEAMGRANGFEVEVVLGSIREASDFLGLPVEKDGRTSYAAPDWAVRLAEAPKGLLYLGELTTTGPSVMRAMLRVLQERVVGDVQLPGSVAIVADANPPSVAVDGFELPAPVANRLMHLDFAFDADDWFAGMAGGFEALQPPDLADLTEDDPKRRQKAVMLVMGFLHHAPHWLSPGVPDDAEQAGRGWASPRSWDNAARVLGYLPARDEEAATLVLSGLVGRAAALEYLAWEKTADLADPRAVLSNPGIVDWGRERPDRLFALMQSLTAMTLADRKLLPKAAKVTAACARGGRPDVALPAIRRLSEASPEEFLGALTDRDRAEFSRLFAATGQWAA